MIITNETAKPKPTKNFGASKASSEAGGKADLEASSEVGGGADLAESRWQG